MKKVLKIVLILIFLFLAAVGIKKSKHHEAQRIGSYICLECMGFR